MTKRKKPKFAQGDLVRKVKGYKFSGRIAVVFYTFTTNELRYVVQHSDGWLMIFNQDQLGKLP